MSTLHTTSAKAPAILVKLLLAMERRGQYADGLAAVEHIWTDVSEPPDVNGFEPGEAAEIMLRCGSLIGFHGHVEQIADSQKTCRNVLTNAHERFLALGDLEKVAECENQLAVSYSRTGETPEAEAYLDSSLARDISRTSDARLHAHVVKSLINLSSKRHKENLEYQKLYEGEFKAYASDYLKGVLCSNIGLSHKNLGNTLDAITYQELAKYHYEKARHKIYLGTVENNLANLYKETGNFTKAHESIDNATKLFKQLKDRTREGFSLDTKASIYFADSKFDEALRTVNRGLAVLRRGENTVFLIDTLLTKAKIILFLDNFAEAVFNLSEAVGIARVQSGDEAAMRLIKDFESAMAVKNTPSEKNLDPDDFELVLPQSIAHYSEYRGIWINSSRFESIGIPMGSLAVVVKAKVERGDLVAVAEIEGGEVICGFYEADFGFVCLESTEGEPQLFNESEIRMLGKIVGVSSSGRNEEGKMIVESLNI